MKCPACETDNRDGVKFCEECGKRFELGCPACGALIPSGKKFCGECGHRLMIHGTQAPNQPSIDSERKNVTVLFSDMSGYTSLTERLDPEDVKDLMSRIFGEITQVIAKYEGFIERFIGDAVMAVFGVPKKHEDDPIRAIKAAREIHALVEGLSPKIEAKTGRPVTMHSGINTGLVITGEVNLEKGTHGITGDAINLASRLEGLAEPDEILVGKETYRQAQDYFVFERLQPLKIKGKRVPITAYRVIAPSIGKTRFEVSAQKGLSPLIGRKRELEMLLEAFKKAQKGKGQAVSIVSEAGLGKSRLLYEFRKAVAKEAVTFLEGRCLSYGKGMAYHPLIDILKSNFDILEADGEKKILEKIERSLKTLDVDTESTIPYLLELLSAGGHGVRNVPSSSESMKNRIVESLKQITLRGAEFRPLVVAVEDLHWIDTSSADVLKEILNCISASRVLLLFTLRPEFVPPWGLKSYHAQLNLSRFSEEQVREMTRRLLDTTDVDPALQKVLFEKTQGNPLFLEEFIRSFVDLKLISRQDNFRLAGHLKEVNIPSTIQDVIMARVDSLPARAKDVVQTGSVIGREFSYTLMSRVTAFSEKELALHLGTLRESELVNERGAFPQTTHIFKHALTRDIVYRSLLNKRKKELHHRVGLAMETLYRDRLIDVCEALAGHFESSEDFLRASEYFKMAGAKATNSGAMTESVNYARKTIESLEKLPPSEAVLKKIVDIRTILGVRLLDLNYFHQAKEMVAPVLGAANQMGLGRRIALMNTILGSYHFCVGEDFPQAFDHHERALDIARNMGDRNLLAMAHYWVGWPKAFNCDFAGALGHFREALDIHVQTGNQMWIPVLSALTGHIACFYWGRQREAYEYSRTAVSLADESGDLYSRLLAYSCHGVSCLGQGELEKALKYLSVGLAVAEQVDQFYWQPGNRQFLGDTHYELHQYQEAIAHYEAAIRELERSGNLPSWKNLIEVALIRTQLAAGEDTRCDVKTLHRYAAANRLGVYDGLVKRYIGESLSFLDDMEGAEQWFERAAARHRAKEMRYHLAGDYAAWSSAHLRRGDGEAARRHLVRSIDAFRESGAGGWVETYEKKLINL